MADIIIQQPAMAPASFGMPACGRTSGTATGRLTGLGATSVVRGHVAQIKGDMGFAPAYVLGTNAWSPPTS